MSTPVIRLEGLRKRFGESAAVEDVSLSVEAGEILVILGASGRDNLAGTDAGRAYVVFGRTATSALDLSAVVAGQGGFAVDGPGASGWTR